MCLKQARAKQISGIWKLHLECRTRGLPEKFAFKMGGIQLSITDDVLFFGRFPQEYKCRLKHVSAA